MRVFDNERQHEARAVGAHTRAWHPRCPVGGVFPTGTHADDCVLARTLATRDDLAPERGEV